MNRIARLRYLATTLLIGASLIASQAFARQQPLQITVFVHQDVTESVESIQQNYLAHWEKAMSDISDREVVFDFVTQANDITTLQYQNEDASVPLKDVDRRFSHYYQANRKAGHGALHKGVLITQRPINGQVDGIAHMKGDIAIASLASYTVPGHELGHLFGATHENATGGGPRRATATWSPTATPSSAIATASVTPTRMLSASI